VCYYEKRFLALALCGVLFYSGIPVMAAAPVPPVDSTDREADSQTAQNVADSVLYYGTVQEIVTDETGAVTTLKLDSNRYGAYIMKISSQTVWIDSGKQTASDPATLGKGEGLYVFHSPVSTRSLTPQSEAFAIVRNTPQDVSCARYHKVEAVSMESGTAKITTDNRGLFLLADENTKVCAYPDAAEADLTALKAGDRIMAWYETIALSHPGQARSSCIMLLGPEDQAPLTRASFAALLHSAEGNPVVNYAINYEDVDAADPYAEAIRWVSSEGFMSGYGNARFGPDDNIERQQAVTALWRRAGSPMLMDYPGLRQYEDAVDISRYAQQAMVWAHQKGLLDTSVTRLEPCAYVTASEIEGMLQALDL